MSAKSIFCLLLIAGIFYGSAPGAFADERIFNGLPTCADGQILVYSNGEPVCGPVCADGQTLIYSNGMLVCEPACADGQIVVYKNGEPLCGPVCADGQTLVYNNGEPTCGPACPAYVYTNLGILEGAAYNVPASEIGDIHPAPGNIGLPVGGARNSILCTFHLQCTPTGWIAITTAADTCPATITDVP